MVGDSLAQLEGVVMPGKEDDEPIWAAEKRDFVADERDVAADERERVADERESAADAREAEVDDWERQMLDRAADTAGDCADASAAARRTGAGDARKLARADRVETCRRRELTTENRVEKGKRRLADASPTMLALAFAEIAAQLYAAGSYDDVLSRIAEAAVSTIAGCGMASVTVPDQTGYRTAASTNAAATAVDQAQYDVDEGPCLDAFGQSVVYAEAFPDRRWPLLAARPTESGVQSTLSYQLTTSRNGVESAIGSLNSYGLRPRAFDDSALGIGLVLAAHASVAARAVDERSTLEAVGRNLHDALMARDVIGQAKGILMERLRVTPEVAFDMLRRASQNLNTKLHEVAHKLSQTGDLPAGSLAAPPRRE